MFIALASPLRTQTALLRKSPPSSCTVNFLHVEQSNSTHIFEAWKGRATAVVTRKIDNADSTQCESSISVTKLVLWMYFSDDASRRSCRGDGMGAGSGSSRSLSDGSGNRSSCNSCRVGVGAAGGQR